MLSDRVRPNIEAAPWVCEEIKRLEAELDDAYAEIMKLSPDGLRHSVVFDRAVHDRARKERDRILARDGATESSL